MGFVDDVRKEADLLPQEKKTKILNLFMNSLSPAEISAHLKININVIHKVIMNELNKNK